MLSGPLFENLVGDWTTTIVENFETEVLGMLTLMDGDSFACACGILGLDVAEQKKSNHKIILIIF